jgi:hypothetical protein
MHARRVYKLAVIHALLGSALLALGLASAGLPRRILMAGSGIGFLGVSVAYFCHWPGFFGKTRNGRILLTSYVLFAPYHLLNWLSLALHRLVFREPAYSEILPGCYLGGRLFPWEAARLLEREVCSVLDLTCELSETRRLRELRAYFCVPLLDRSAPSPDELEIALDFLRQRAGKGPVYVHCALGHGRSAAVLAAWLAASGQAGSGEEALEIIRARRPSVRLSSVQKQMLARV